MEGTSPMTWTGGEQLPKATAIDLFHTCLSPSAKAQFIPEQACLPLSHALQCARVLTFMLYDWHRY